MASIIMTLLWMNGTWGWHFSLAFLWPLLLEGLLSTIYQIMGKCMNERTVNCAQNTVIDQSESNILHNYMSWMNHEMYNSIVKLLLFTTMQLYFAHCFNWKVLECIIIFCRYLGRDRWYLHRLSSLVECLKKSLILFLMTLCSSCSKGLKKKTRHKLKSPKNV